MDFCSFRWRGLGRRAVTEEGIEVLEPGFRFLPGAARGRTAGRGAARWAASLICTSLAYREVCYADPWRVLTDLDPSSAGWPENLD